MKDRFQRRAGAIKTLYALLTADQKRAFDAYPLGELLGAGGGRGGKGRAPGHAG